MFELRESDTYDRETRDVRSILQYDNNADVYFRWGAYTLAEDKRDFMAETFERANLCGDERVVDIGALDGGNMVRLRDEFGHKGDITCVDVNRQLLEKQPSTGDAFEHFVEDGQAMHFDDDSFDVLFASFCLYHFSDPEAGLREFQRVVRPGGKIIIATSGRYNKILHRIFEHKQAAHMTQQLQNDGLDQEVLPPPIFNRTFTRQIGQQIVPQYFHIDEKSEVLQQVPLLVTNPDEEEIYKQSLISMKSEFTRRTRGTEENISLPYSSLWLPSYEDVVEPVIQGSIADVGYFSDYIDRWAVVGYNTMEER